MVFERKEFEPNILGTSGLQRDYVGAQNHQLDRVLTNVCIHFDLSINDWITSVTLNLEDEIAGCIYIIFAKTQSEEERW